MYLHSEKHKVKTLVFQYRQNRESVVRAELTFQSNDVTSLLLGTSWPPSRMQCLRTSCVELLLLFSLRFQMRAVESPDLWRARALNNSLTSLSSTDAPITNLLTVSNLDVYIIYSTLFGMDLYLKYNYKWQFMLLECQSKLLDTFYSFYMKVQCSTD